MQNYFDTVSPPHFAADFHYFRIAREKWEVMLTRLAQMGVNMLSITAPWGFHEFEKGTLDLTGATASRRDLVGLIELCAALNFHCILKPGPYSNNSGVLADGLPYWLSPESKDFNTTLKSAAERWFRGLSKTLVNHQWPDGPIAALYIDDEGQQFSPTYSQELTEVRWPIWLRKHYQGIDALNAAYGTTYRTVSRVPFPQSWTDNPTPLEEDAKTFLLEVQGDAQSDYTNILVEAGWQIPIYPAALDTHPGLPAIQDHSLLVPGDLPALEPDTSIVNLQHPIQVDPDPTDIGSGPVWANGAPIRPDGSVRRTFWDVRRGLWAQSLTINADAHPLTLAFDNGGLVTSRQDIPLKIPLAKGTKPAIYRLDMTGTVQSAATLKTARARLSGPYLTEDDTTQTDFIFYLNDPTAPLSDFLLSYLRMLLKAQAQVLTRCAVLSKNLSQNLNPAQPPAQTSPPAAKRPTSYTLAEARRGLRQADSALRKAMASIGGLETGFDTILGKSSHDTPEPAASSLSISPEIFEGRARDIVIKAGQVCQAIIPDLESAAKAVQQTVDAQKFTLEQYQQSHSQAIGTAQNTREALLEIIAELRVEIISEQLPLVVWRVHNQIQEVAESLRRGVMGNDE